MVPKLQYSLIGVVLGVKVDSHQVGISVPGATLGDRSTSCLGRHLCQSDNDVNDDDNDVIDGDNDNDVNGVNDGDTDEAVVAECTSEDFCVKVAS